ncbi:MAG: hypothetical protein ABSA93_20390 [Streptosporangiaceae bacterium]|jgi:hypothetical protein
MTLSLSRCLDGVADQADAVPGSARLQRALTLAETRLAGATADLETPTVEKARGPLRRLVMAADALDAGADLLGTHTRSDLVGRRVDQSTWAPVLRSQPFAEALTAEVMHWSDRIAAMCAVVLRTGVLAGNRTSFRVQAARGYLTTAKTIVAADLRADPPWELLYAIPLAIPPARIPLTRDEPSARLCEGVEISAARLKALAFAGLDQADSAGEISAPAWRRAAHFAAITADIGRRAAEAAMDDADGSSLRVAAVALGAVCDAWRQATGVWDVITTDTRSPVSPATTDAEDLMLRLGRLVYGNPEWKPGRAAGSPDVRGPFTQVLSAVHTVTDALESMAGTDLGMIRRFGHQGRFYIPRRFLDVNYPESREYLRAPIARVHLAVEAYQVAVLESGRAAQVLDELVLRSDAPGKALAMAGKAANRDTSAIADVNPEQIAKRLQYLDRP